MADPLAEVMRSTPRTPGKVLAEQLRRYRSDVRGWSLRDFSEQLAARFDVKIDAATLGRMETGDRRVTVDEASMFAVALGVPLGLLLWPVDEVEEVTVAPGFAVSPWMAFEWTIGNHRIGPASDDSMPVGRVDDEEAAWRRSTVILRTYSRVRNLVRQVAAARGDSDERRVLLRELAEALMHAGAFIAPAAPDAAWQMVREAGLDGDVEELLAQPDESLILLDEEE